MKKIVDQIRFSAEQKNKLFFKKIKIKWYLVENKNHYYEIKIDQKIQEHWFRVFLKSRN
jgi:hypothetical protein